MEATAKAKRKPHPRKLVPIRDEKERNEIAVENLGLVRYVAKRSSREVSMRSDTGTISFDFDDVYQDAAKRLIERCGTFDPEKGTLATHAVWTMMQVARRRSKQVSKPVSVTLDSIARLVKLRKVMRENGLSLDKDGFDKAFPLSGMTRRKFQCAVAAAKVYEAGYFQADQGRREKCLDRLAKRDDGDRDIEADDENETFPEMMGKDDRLETMERREFVAVMLSGLTSQESKVFRLYYGLDGKEPLNMRETAEVMGLTYQRIQQILARAIKVLRERFKHSDYAMEAA